MKAILQSDAPQHAGILLAYGAGRKRISDPELKSLPRSFAAARYGLTKRLIDLLESGEPVALARYEQDVVAEALAGGFDETAAAAQAWRVQDDFRRLSRLSPRL